MGRDAVRAHQRVRHQARARVVRETPALSAIFWYCSTALVLASDWKRTMNFGYLSKRDPSGFFPLRYLPLSAPPAEAFGAGQRVWRRAL